MEHALRAGIAIYNAGEYHAAHDAWEDHWLELPSGTEDERFLHGLIQYTAALHHAHNANWAGCSGLVESARTYLADLAEDYRAVNLDAIRQYLDALYDDPEHVERAPPPTLTHRGEPLRLADLRFDAAAAAADVFAEESDDYDEAVIADAISLATAALEDDRATHPVVTLIMDFVGDAENRDIIYHRLTQHVDRMKQRRQDVDGLFDEG